MAAVLTQMSTAACTRLATVVPSGVTTYRSIVCSSTWERRAGAGMESTNDSADSRSRGTDLAPSRMATSSGSIFKCCTPGKRDASLFFRYSCHEARKQSDRAVGSASPAVPEANGEYPPFLRRWFGLPRTIPVKRPANCGEIALVVALEAERHQTSDPERGDSDRVRWLP